MGFADRKNRAMLSSEKRADEILFDLQVEQHEHDETYHREIARLSLHHRLNHMALHFAKYTGKVAATTDPTELRNVLVDVFVIALSTANILNAHLGELLEPDPRDFCGLVEFGRAVDCSIGGPDHTSLLSDMAQQAGRIAGACEKIDHLEEINFRAEIRTGIGRLATMAIAAIASQGVDPAEATRERLRNVKQRLKLHGRI